MSAATRRFVGASGAATRKISRPRKARAWGVAWARARDAKPWRSSSVNLSGGAKGMGIVALLIGREGCRDGCRVRMPSHYPYSDTYTHMLCNIKVCERIQHH